MERGFRVVEFGEPTDVFVLNTCTVTERADRECRKLIRSGLRVSPNACAIVVGCYAQLQAEEIAAIDGVDYVFGSNEKFTLLERVGDFQKRTSAEIACNSSGKAVDFGPAFSGGAAHRTRGFLKVQDGCDYRCSFCTIPLARGVSRSQSMDATVEQARALVHQGYKEIVLTGVNVGDYGRKIGTDLMCLLRRLEETEGLDRIRISSIEPNLLTREMIQHVRQSDKICHHFHIPLQSGNDDVLKLMQRRYLADDYRDLIIAIRDEIPHAGIGTDVIVGFPGETESHFEKTYRFLADLPVSYLHVFAYSERPNTLAANLPGSIAPRVRARRSEFVRTLSLKKRRQFYESFVGWIVPVLMEGTVERNLRIGHTSHYVRVGVPMSLAQENEIVDVEITRIEDLLCVGNIHRDLHTKLPDESLVEVIA